MGVSLGTLIAFLDNNVVNVALPSIQRHFTLTIPALEWVMSSYIMVFAALLLTGGRLADMFGRRLMFLVGFGIFTAASLLAGLAGNETVLIIARVLQGVGAAAGVPTILAIIYGMFPDERERAQAVGVWATVGGMAMLLGPFIGGFVTQEWGWSWIFYINIPIGAVTLALAAAAVPETRAAAGRRLDFPGLLAFAATLFTLAYGLIEGHDMGWSSPLIVGSFMMAAAATAAFIMIELRSPDPMLDLKVFRSRIFAGGIAAMLFWGLGVLGIYFFTSMYLQNVLQFKARLAGSTFTPMAVCIVVMASVAPIIAGKIGTHLSTTIGLTLIAIALLWTTTVGESAHWPSLVAPFVCFGIGTGFTVAPLNNIVMDGLPPEQAGTAAAINNANHELADLLGVTIVGALLTTRQASEMHKGASEVHAFYAGYHFSLIVAAIIVAIGAPIAFFTLRSDAGTAMKVEPEGSENSALAVAADV